jgi:hypothetical protein
MLTLLRIAHAQLGPLLKQPCSFLKLKVINSKPKIGENIICIYNYFGPRCPPPPRGAAWELVYP